MSRRQDLTLVPGPQERPAAPAPDEQVVTLDDLQEWRRSGRLLRSIGRYRSARYLVYDLGFVHLPLKTSVVLRLLARGRCRLEDRTGRTRSLGILWFVAAALRWVRERRQLPGFLTLVRREVADLRAAAPRPGRLDRQRPSAYLRTDLVFDVRAGGAVAHMSGMLNGLARVGAAPVFLTTAPVPTVSASVRTVQVLPDQRFWDFKEIPRLAFTHRFADVAGMELEASKPSLLYQRYSTNNYSGVLLARRLGVPFVLEYNGSEVWIARHWGNPMPYEDVCLAVEDLNLAAADLVVVVSRVLADELAERGVDPAKVLVEPNGVDTAVYHPGVDGAAVRRRWDLDGKLVVGFIGTFGRWHGAEVLPDAVADLLARRSDLRDRLRVLLIGDGLTMPLVRSRIAANDLGDVCLLPGLVPQEQGPEHLAACDVLAAPHVPNPDGSPFFGSPTKLFEYLAMGRPVVASALDQIAEVLEHGRTGWLVEPGSATALSAGLEAVLDDEALRRRLAEAARAQALAHHDWSGHAVRVLAALEERCG